MPNQISDINLFDSWRSNVIVLITIPIILLGCIYISYGELIDGIMADQNFHITSIIELNTQLNIFQSGFASSQPLGSMPEIVRVIGYNTVITLYILLLLWIVSFSVSSYVKLSNRKGSKFLMFIEILFMIVVYTYSVKPGISSLLSILGYLILSILLVILLMYWVYGIKNRG